MPGSAQPATGGDEDSAPALRDTQALIEAKRFDEALAVLARLLAENPDNQEALYMRAVCRRYTRDFSAALADIDRLKSLVPEHGRAFQEEGHTYRDMGNAEAALQAYGLACRFNPALVASWRGQLEILRRSGQAERTRAVQHQLEQLLATPKPLIAVLDLIAQGRLLKAEELCRQFLLKVPDNVEGMRLLADIGRRLGVLDDAEFLLESALKLQPSNANVRIDYIRTLRKRQKFPQALSQARQLLEFAPDNLQYQSLFAIENMQSGDYETALVYFDGILAKLPGDPVTLTSKGHALKTSGKYDQAVDAYRSAIKSEMRHGEAWYSLANLKVYSFRDAEIERMVTLLDDRNLAHMDRVYLNFALGKAFEDRGEYETSFSHYKKGNDLKKAQSTYDAARMSADLDAQHSVCTADFFGRRAGSGYVAPDPIFIVGLPRAGSTLLEQILSSHPQVDGTLELPNILALTQRLRRWKVQDTVPGYPVVMEKLDAAEFERFGMAFIDETRVHRQGAPFFIDKMPNNFRHIGLIHLMLPNARIIDARRHPMACGFSGYKQLFAEGQEFSYDLRNIGRYYRDYVKLMEHWDEVLPGKVLRVQYEDVVGDLDGQVRRLLDHCDLPFDEACVDYHRTDRSVRTPSSEQVRQPIFTSALADWKNYRPWLEPLSAALGPAIRQEYLI